MSVNSQSTTSEDSLSSMAATIGLRDLAAQIPPSGLQRRSVEYQPPASTTTISHGFHDSPASILLSGKTTPGVDGGQPNLRGSRVGNVAGRTNIAASRSPSKHRMKDPDKIGKDYWSPWIPSKNGTVPPQSRILLRRDVSPGSHVPARTSSMTAELATPQRQPDHPTSANSDKSFPAGGYPSNNSLNHSRQYSLTMSAEHLAAAVQRNGSWNSQTKHRRYGSGRSSRNVRSAPASPAHFTDQSTMSHRDQPGNGLRQPPQDEYFLGVGTEFSPVPRHKPQVIGDGLLPTTPGLLQSQNPLAIPTTLSDHSSNSSRSETKPHRNYSYPSMHHSTPEPRNDLGASPSTNEMGVDGQIDRSRYRMERSKSNSIDYSPEAYRRLHGRVTTDNNVVEGGTIGRTRPPLTSRTSSQYSKLADPAIVPPLNVTRRSSYSSATGISPVAEGYASNFIATSAESHSRKHSARGPLSVDTRVAQVDGTLNSPIRGSGSVPESPIGGQFTPSPVERKRVDDFDFLNTIEASARPYTPDRFVIDAGMLNLTKGTSTTRNSSQRSKRSLASFGGLSKRSTGISNSAVQPPPHPHPPTRNVLRKKNPSLKTSQVDGNGFNTGSQSSLENKGFLRGSLRSLSRSKELDDAYSLDMPHTATTCAGPSRGLIKESSRISLAENKGLHPRTGRNSFFGLTKVNPFVKGKSKHETPVRDAKNNSNPRRVASSRPKRSNTFSYLASSRKLSRSASSPNFAASNQSIQTRAESTTSSEAPSSTQTFATSDQSPSYYLSTFYSEGRQVLRQAWHDGWTAAVEDLRERRELEKTYRYGAAGKKVSAFMSGARQNGTTTQPIKGKHSTRPNIPWLKNHQQRNYSSGGLSNTDRDGQHMSSFQGGYNGVYVGPSNTRANDAKKAEGATETERNAISGNMDKKSVFTEVFERSQLPGGPTHVDSGDRGNEEAGKRKNSGKTLLYKAKNYLTHSKD
ncbi:hypothetical protein K440DRAFT_617488, partial [Wilcoxina mikolae CBS 423.85]